MHDVDLLTGARATALDVAGRALVLDSGRRLAFAELLIATGGAPRTLPGTECFDNVHVLRTIDDARRDALVPGSRLASAATPSSSASGLSQRRAGCAGSGLDDRGVRVDAAGRTRVPGIYAAGDASRAFDARIGAHVRTEHWEAAARQGAAAARAMLGLDPPPPAIPSFWSEQHGLRIQYLGHIHGANAITIDGETGRSRLHRHLHPRRHARRRTRASAAPTPSRGPAGFLSRSMTLIPHVDEFACAALGDYALVAPGVFTVEDIAIVTGEGTDEAILVAAPRLPRRRDHGNRQGHGRACLPVSPRHCRRCRCVRATPAVPMPGSIRSPGSPRDRY